MEVGHFPSGPEGELFRRVALSIVVSQSVELSSWNLDLRSPFWRLYVNRRSGAALVHEGKRLPLRPGTVCLIPAWVRFQTVAARGVVQEFLHFHVTGLPPRLPEGGFDRPFQCPMGPLEPSYRAWHRGFAQAGGQGLAELGWAYALAHGALALAVGALTPGDRRFLHGWFDDSEGLRPALDLLDGRLAEPPRNRELAALCGMSADHFIRRFRGVVGMTPARYGIERRIATAANWLVGTDWKIDAVADAAGFTDRFHFSHAFKTRTGVSPAAYRRAHRKAG